MAKQVYNTRGRTIAQIEEDLIVRKSVRPMINYKISSWQELIDNELFVKQKNETEISYLEKYLEKKKRSQ